jgi:hypothetical protein
MRQQAVHQALKNDSLEVAREALGKRIGRLHAFPWTLKA